MADRLVTFGAEGAEGPPGLVNVPTGRGILGYAGGNVFGVPESSVEGNVLTVGPSGVFTFAPVSRLPTTAGVPDAGKVVTWNGSAYALTTLPSQIPAGGPGLVGKNAAGEPTVFAFAAAPEGAFARIAGSTVVFTPLFSAEGYVKASTGGAISYVTIGNGLQEVSGVLSARAGAGAIVNANGIAPDPAAWAALSGGKTTAAQGRGKTEQAGGRIEASTLFPISAMTQGAAPSALIATLGSVAIGEVIIFSATFDHDNTVAVPCVVEITSSVTPNTGTIYSTILLNVQTCGAVSERWVATVAGTHFVHLRAFRWNAIVPAYNMARRRIVWSILKD